MSCDCNNPNLNSCENPCGCSTTNTAACESLPSQIENFTAQFFGTIQKTETNGVVNWVLPCNLDIGLPANPRSEDEGLACYFLRLFDQGIVGLKGDPGTPGAAGAPGNNSYTVTLASFTQPTVGNPLLQIFTSYNPAILDGEYVFIQNSGWYLVNSTDGNGTLFLTLVAEVSGASGTITAGKLVVPTGPPGATVVGPQGLQGPKGDTGAAGVSFTATRGFYYNPGGGGVLDFTLPGSPTWEPVDFINSPASILLPSAGTYLVTVITSFEVENAVVAGTVEASFKLQNTSTSVDVPGSTQVIKNLFQSQYSQVYLQAQVTTVADNQTVALFATTNAAVDVIVPYPYTTISYVRLA